MQVLLKKLGDVNSAASQPIALSGDAHKRLLALIPKIRGNYLRCICVCLHYIYG